MTLLSLFSKKGSMPTTFKRKKRKINFELMAPKANQVRLTGDFVDWDENGLKMKKNTKGVWKIGVSLCAGKYEYKFIVDDQWRIDPQNSDIVDNNLGSINSVRDVVL